MAKLKEEPRPDFRDYLKEEIERIDRERPIVESRWYVLEIVPGYQESGYYGQWVSSTARRVSEYFYDRDEVDEWLETHEPDNPKNSFRVKQENKRRIEQWVGY